MKKHELEHNIIQTSLLDAMWFQNRDVFRDMFIDMRLKFCRTCGMFYRWE